MACASCSGTKTTPPCAACAGDGVDLATGKACAPGPCEPDPAQECSPDAQPHQLTPVEARGSLMSRIAPRIDRLRQKTVVRFGLRPYNVDLVWSRWTGVERGAGHEVIVKRIPVVPNPRVIDLTSVAMSPVSTGILPVGSVRLEQVSACYASDALMGLIYPDRAERVPPNVDFYYEVYEDGRSGTGPRMKFRPASEPMKRPGKVDWTMVLERVSKDARRDGAPRTEAGP